MNEYPRRLYHNTPAWVGEGALFHVRIRAAPQQNSPLTDPALGPALLDAARRYHESGRWWCELFLLMPDHLHALIAFPPEPGMSATVRDWKRGAARFQRVQWQENYFDHRLRNAELSGEAWAYVRRNPVVNGLCANEEAWPWQCRPAFEKGGAH